MLEQIISIAVMIVSLLAGAAAVFSRSTGTKTWAAVAFSASFGYAALSYIATVCGESAFIPVTALGVVSLAVTGLSFVFAITEVSGVLVPKKFKFTIAAIGAIYIAFISTMHLHGLCMTAGPIVEGSATYNYSIVFCAANVIIAAAAASVSVFSIYSMSKKLVKVSSGMKFLAVLSILLIIFAVLGGVVSGAGVITPICVLAADLLLLLMIRKLDIADILEFGKSCSIDSTNDGVVILDNSKNYLFANRTAKSVFVELMESDREKLSKFISTVTESDSIKRGDRVFSLKKINYTDFRGNCDCIVVMIHDVTEQELRTSRLNEEASIDSITGLYNRAKLIEILADTCQEESGTLLMVSFDGFKRLNSIYGHEEANKLLASFGILLKNNTNSDDVRGKLGGEMFAIFLKNCVNEGVVAHLTMRLEDQINDALKKQFGESVDISVGVSIGGVTVPDNGRDYDALAAIAEKELNKIKDSGGHGYSLCSGSSNTSGGDFIELSDDFMVNTPEKKEETTSDTSEIMFEEIEFIDNSDSSSDE